MKHVITVLHWLPGQFHDTEHVQFTFIHVIRRRQFEMHPRLLPGNEFASKDLWHHAKPLVRPHETGYACLIFDDAITGKPYADENGLTNWHWNHSKGRDEKGISLLAAFCHSQPVEGQKALRVPASDECMRKTVRYCEIKTRKEKRQIPVAKNGMMRAMIIRAIEKQHLPFQYVLADSWFSSSGNLLFIHKLKEYFLTDIKSNRLCMSATADRNKGRWSSLDKLGITPGQPVKAWMEDLEIPVLLCKRVLTNKIGGFQSRME
ncbi:hypothetical protein FACS189435_2200 [Bacteroidia bacterium]|nr:hypothetical protein FACS189435_2200 [Bacteroidia bacterium]